MAIAMTLAAAVLFCIFIGRSFNLLCTLQV